jgi:hypothetical protein
LSARVVNGGFRSVSAVPYHNDKRSNAPLLEHYRSGWPDVNPDVPAATQPELTKRTIPDEILRFNFSASFNKGGAFFYPHLLTNPADFKVSMKVRH